MGYTMKKLPGNIEKLITRCHASIKDIDVDFDSEETLNWYLQRVKQLKIDSFVAKEAAAKPIEEVLMIGREDTLGSIDGLLKLNFLSARKGIIDNNHEYEAYAVASTIVIDESDLRFVTPQDFTAFVNWMDASYPDFANGIKDNPQLSKFYKTELSEAYTFSKVFKNSKIPVYAKVLYFIGRNPGCKRFDIQKAIWGDPWKDKEFNDEDRPAVWNKYGITAYTTPHEARGYASTTFAQMIKNRLIVNPKYNHIPSLLKGVDHSRLSVDSNDGYYLTPIGFEKLKTFIDGVELLSSKQYDYDSAKYEMQFGQHFMYALEAIDD